MKAPLCHVTNPQLRDTEVGLPVASQLASLADSSDPGSRVFSALKKRENYPSDLHYQPWRGCNAHDRLLYPFLSSASV